MDRHETLECICPTCGGQPAEKKVIEKKKEVCDIEFGYDYLRAPDESAKNLNGFGGSLFCNVRPWIAFGGDFDLLFGSITDTLGTTKIDVSLHRQTYLFGPQFNFYPNEKVRVDQAKGSAPSFVIRRGAAETAPQREV
jgi:hypothetical protein